MGIQIQQVLAEVGWTDGYRVPVADEANRKLELEVEEKLKRKNTISLQLAELKERVDTTEKYLRNVETEKQQNQALLSAHRQQLESEQHMARLAEAQRNQLTQEMREMRKAATALRERCENIKKETKQHSDKLEKLKSTVKVERQTLTEWEEELARGEESTGLLERYVHEDEKEARDLEVERLRLRGEVDERRRILEELITEAATAHTALERSGQMFRQMHRERRQLVAQWEMTVREMHARDRDIRSVLDEIASMHVTEREREDALQEQVRFYENEVNNNQERELKLTRSERANAMLAESNSLLDKSVEELAQQLVLMKRDLESASRRLDEERYHNIRTNKQIKADTANAENTREAVAALEARIAKIKDDCTSAADRVKEIEDMIKAEERYLHNLGSDMERANKIRLAAESQLLELKREEQLQEMEMQAINTTKAALKSRMMAIEKDIRRQREVLYNLDFEAQRLEGRILMASGQMDVENKEELESKIHDAEQQLKQKREEHSLLTGQVRQLEDTMRRIQANMGIDDREMRALENRRQDGLLLTEGGEKQVVATRRLFQEKQVEESLLRLRLRQAEEALNREGDALYSLDKQRLELDSLMRERKVEIALHSDMMTTKKRCVAEESARLNLEVNHRRLRTDQLRNKFAIAQTALGHDDDGQLQDVATVRVQLAQEKYLLQLKGDELDAEIRKAEKEIQALENTLKVLNATNDAYKKNLSAVEEEAPEYQEKKELENEVSMVLEEMRHSRSVIKDEDVELKAMEGMHAEVMEEEAEARAQLDEKQREVAELEKELDEQDVKIERALKQVRALTKELRGRRKTTDTSLEERDIDLREQTEQNRAALNMLLEMAVRHPEAEPVIGRYLQDKGLELPAEGLPGLGASRLSARTAASLLESRLASRVSHASGSSSSLSLASEESVASAECRPDLLSGPRRSFAPSLGSRAARDSQRSRRFSSLAARDSVSLAPSVVTLELSESSSTSTSNGGESLSKESRSTTSSSSTSEYKRK